MGERHVGVDKLKDIWIECPIFKCFWEVCIINEFTEMGRGFLDNGKLEYPHLIYKVANGKNSFANKFPVPSLIFFSQSKK